MRLARVLPAMAAALIAGPLSAQDEPQPYFPPSEIDLRDGIALPPAETVRHRGKRYDVRFVPEGGFGYTHKVTGEEGQFRTDLFLVGGAKTQMEAVGVYLRYCHGKRQVDPVWGDEYVPQVKGTGEYAFQYPDDCPAWRASHG